MGTPELGGYCAVDASSLWGGGQIEQTVQEVLRGVLGEAPSPAQLRRWSGGYRQYLRLISSPVGKRVAPRALRERERGAVYDSVRFPEQFTEAVAQSVRWVDALADYAADGGFDASARSALEKAIPEGTIDPVA
jgi:hypothetical protein